MARAVGASGRFALGERVERHQRTDQALEFGERHHVGTIGRRTIGIRMSLGADSARVQRMVLGEGGTLLLYGLFLGVAGALVGTRLMRGLLFGVAPNDPMTLVGVTVMMVLVDLIFLKFALVSFVASHPDS